MPSTKVILTSIHGRALGISADNHLVLWGRTIPMVDDTGAMIVKQPAPGALNATGTLTAALMKSGIVTSTTAAAVTATPDTGALIDASFTAKQAMAIDDSFDFSVLATGANALTLSVGGGVAGITLVGNMVVASGSQGVFRVRKTAASTFTIYRVS